jgi:hypothetical protein
MGPHFCFPPGLFPDSYLVTLPAGSVLGNSYLVLLLAGFLVFLDFESGEDLLSHVLENIAAICWRK